MVKTTHTEVTAKEARASEAVLTQLLASMTQWDSTLASVRQQHPWMFRDQHLGMRLPKKWLPSFTALCDDIAFLLGERLRGFHWRQLAIAEGEPLWLWRFDDDVEVLLATVLRSTPTRMACQQAASDPQSDVFCTIQEWVHIARQRALEQGRVGRSVRRARRAKA